MTTFIRYKIGVIWSDGITRPFDTWPEIEREILSACGGVSHAYNMYIAYQRQREGWDLSSNDELRAMTWRNVLENTFRKFSRPACAVIVMSAEREALK